MYLIVTTISQSATLGYRLPVSVKMTRDAWNAVDDDGGGGDADDSVIALH